jgi:23S rRNA (pseudouridine1915-N3)-methyltransferase
MRFEDAIRALGQRTMPGASAGALDGWLAERLQRRADVGLPWTFTAINGRHLELEERRKVEGAELMAREATLLLDAIPRGAFAIALDPRGKAATSELFATQLGQLRDAAASI